MFQAREFLLSVDKVFLTIHTVSAESFSFIVPLFFPTIVEPTVCLIQTTVITVTFT